MDNRAHQPLPGSRWLSWSPLRWRGSLSYGLYLYHFPILSVLRHHVDVGPLEARMVVAVILSIVVAWASFRWWETPFLKLKDRTDPKSPATVVQKAAD